MTIRENIVDRFFNFGYMRNASVKIGVFLTLYDYGEYRKLVHDSYEKTVFTLDHAGYLVIKGNPHHPVNRILINKYFNLINKKENYYVYKRKSTLMMFENDACKFISDKDNEINKVLPNYNWEEWNNGKV